MPSSPRDFPPVGPPIEVTSPSATSDNRVFALILISLLGFGVLLVTVPRFFATDPSVLSAASEQGFNTNAAFLVALTWSIAVLVMAGLLLGKRGWSAASENGDVPVADWRADGRPFFLTLVIVVGVIAIAYFPPFIARYGPYQEDAIFLNLLHRMDGGMQPYRDFEFLYGPMMIAPVVWLTQLTGYNTLTYYTYYAVLECAVGAVLVWWAFRRIPKPTERYVAIIVLLALLLNPFLGLNYNGLRRLLPVIAIALLAIGRDRSRLRLASALVTGFTLSYVHEMGTAALAGAGAVFGVELLRGERSTRGSVIRDGLVYLAVSVCSWLGFIALVLGRGVVDYLREIASLVPRFAAGEAGFAFSWTLNSLALFALVSVTLVLVGRGLVSRATIPMTPGDRFILASLVVAIVALKSGLTRSDMYHLDTGIVALAMAFLFPLNARLFAPSVRIRHLGMVSAAVIGATYGFGNLPTVSMIARGWVRGARDVTSGQVRGQTARFDPVAPSSLLKATNPSPSLVGLARYVSEPERRGKPVFFYGRRWALGPIIGVYKEDFLNDNFIYSDARGERARGFLVNNSEALVLMNRPDYERLWGIRPDTAFDVGEYGMAPSLVKRVASKVSSVHYDAAPLEARVHAARWRRTVGNYVRANYDSIAAFGSVMVLRRRM